MAEFIEALRNIGIAEELIVIIIATLPIVELRGALPLAIGLFRMPWHLAFCLALIGNLIPVPVLLIFFEPLAKAISKIKIGKRLVDWVLKRTRRSNELIERYELIGLVLFVAIPLPVTGAWTGSIAAFLCGMKFSRAFLAILCGLIIAGTIVTCLCLLGWIGAIIVGIGLCALAVLGWWRV